MADLNTYLSRLFYRVLPLTAGSVTGTLTASTTTAQTGADTNETDLWTYSLPANALSANASGVRITAWLAGAANVNAKTVRLYFGSTVVSSSVSSSSGETWRLTADVLRTGATAQVASGVRFTGGAALGQAAAPAETLTGAVTIKVTGQNGTASAGDIVFKAAMVELVGSPN